MYPRNAASPERFAVGAVVQISDGAVQTSGVSVTVTPMGGAEGAGAGTVAYSARGIVWYTPTQGETNYTSLIVEAGKTGCIPVSVTIVTSASATPGHAGTDQSKIANPTSTVALSGTTIATTQKVDVETIKTNAVVNGGTVTFPTNATLASTTNITAGTITTATNLTNAPTNGDLTAAMKASVNTEADAALSDVGLTPTITGRIDVATSTRASQTSVDDVPTNSELATALADLALSSDVATLLSRLSATRAGYLDNLGAALTEAYRADGATGTLAQLLYEIVAHLGESSISGATKTIKKIDGSTTAATFTLDDAVTPTSITRAS